MSTPVAKRRRLLSGPDGFDFGAKQPKLAAEIVLNTATPTRKPPEFKKLDPMLSTSSPLPKPNLFSSRLGSTLETSRQSTKPLKPPRPHVFLTPRRPKTPPPHKNVANIAGPSTPLLTNRPIFPPPLHSITPKSSHPVALKPSVPPQIEHLMEPPSPKQLRPLSTTSIAVATNISTELGTVGLAGILVKGSHSEDEDDIQQSMRRGVHASPQKASSRAKYIKGGLADCASSVLVTTQTSHLLWARETSRLLLDASNRLQARPDLILTISSILEDLSSHAGSTSASSAGIAFCYSPASLIAPSRTCLIHLEFDATRNTRSPLQNSELFHPGNEVWLWKPWCTITLPERTPMPEAHQQDWDGTTLLCDRFALLNPS